MIKYVPLILSGVLLNAVAQLFLKQGMLQIGHFDFTVANALTVGAKVATSPSVALGLGCYGLSVGLWLLVLSRVDVSFAYPFLSVGYVVTAAIGYTMFNEAIGVARVLGIALICLGVIFIARS